MTPGVPSEPLDETQKEQRLWTCADANLPELRAFLNLALVGVLRDSNADSFLWAGERIVGCVECAELVNAQADSCATHRPLYGLLSTCRDNAAVGTAANNTS